MHPRVTRYILIYSPALSAIEKLNPQKSNLKKVYKKVVKIKTTSNNCFKKTAVAAFVFWRNNFIIILFMAVCFYKTLYLF